MLIEEVIMDSPGQTFIPLINIRHSATYVYKTSLTMIGLMSDKIVNSVDDMKGRLIDFNTYMVCKNRTYFHALFLIFLIFVLFTKYS